MPGPTNRSSRECHILLGIALLAQALISCGGSNNGSNLSPALTGEASVVTDSELNAAGAVFPFALWGPWNDGKEPPPVPTPVHLTGVIEFDGPCAYLVVTLANYGSESRERLFGAKPGQSARVLLVFPDDSPLGSTRWDEVAETASYRGRELRAGDYVEWGDWYYSRHVDLNRRLPLRWGQAGKRVIQKWDDSCEAEFVLGL